MNLPQRTRRAMCSAWSLIWLFGSHHRPRALCHRRRRLAAFSIATKLSWFGLRPRGFERRRRDSCSSSCSPPEPGEEVRRHLVRHVGQRQVADRVHHPVIAPGGKHVQIRRVNACGVARMFTAPSTPSDYRSVDNCRAGVRRILREDGMRPAAESKPPPRQLSRIELLERRVAELERRLSIDLSGDPELRDEP
jgi:hypothetical protein